MLGKILIGCIIGIAVALLLLEFWNRPAAPLAPVQAPIIAASPSVHPFTPPEIANTTVQQETVPLMYNQEGPEPVGTMFGDLMGALTDIRTLAAPLGQPYMLGIDPSLFFAPHA